MIDHERIEELIAVRVLGGLDPDDELALRQEMTDHGDCPECRRLEADYGEVAGQLASALESAPIPEGMEDAIVHRATRERTAVPPPGREGPSRGATPRWVRPLVAVAASVVLLVAGWALGSATGGDDGVPVGARVVAFEGDADGSLSVAYLPGEEGVYLLGSELEAPPEGAVYEVWLFQDGTPVSATCLTPSADGSVFSFVDVELGTTEAMAVTVEPASCPAAPSTEPILTAQIAV